MKKLLSLLLALMMLVLPMAAMAEENLEIYVDPTDTYGFAYPSDWILLSKETITELMASTEIEDENFLAFFESLKPTFEQSEMVMIYAPDLQTNINLVVNNVGAHATAEELLAQMPTMEQMLQQQMPGLEFVVEPEIIESDKYQYVLVAYTYEIQGVPMVAMQALTSQGENLYTFTLTINLVEGVDTALGEDVFSTVLLTAELN